MTTPASTTRPATAMTALAALAFAVVIIVGWQTGRPRSTPAATSGSTNTIAGDGDADRSDDAAADPSLTGPEVVQRAADSMGLVESVEFTVEVSGDQSNRAVS